MKGEREGGREVGWSVLSTEFQVLMVLGAGHSHVSISSAVDVFR